MRRLEGKAIILTGGGSGIGLLSTTAPRAFAPMRFSPQRSTKPTWVNTPRKTDRVPRPPRPSCPGPRVGSRSAGRARSRTSTGRRLPSCSQTMPAISPVQPWLWTAAISQPDREGGSARVRETRRCPSPIGPESLSRYSRPAHSHGAAIKDGARTGRFLTEATSLGIEISAAPTGQGDRISRPGRRPNW